MLKVRWLAVALSIIVLGVLGIIAIEPFLAYNHPVGGEVLIVEAWLDPFYMPMAVQEFRRGGYRHIFTVGGPRPSGPQMGQETDAESSARILVQLGIDPSLITAVSAPPVKIHKTWSFARALRDHMISSGYTVKTADVFTLWVHARKSQILYQKALGPTVQVGVIAAKHQRFGHGRWWFSPRGIYAVAKNTVAYLGALIL